MKEENNFKIKPCNKNIGAEIICNLQLIKKRQIKIVKKSLNKYGVVFFRNQNLDSKTYIKFAKKFGQIF